ncbi:MAG: DUF4062 domain-containing protein [Lachnospiraceae bacterium]|nr:DUF4062 domain-containing protein [Lachnospiraceae bacterium]
MSQKKYSVFVSSVYKSLKDERDSVINAIMQMGYFPVAMENQAVGNFREIQRLIDDSDAFLLLLGDQYGSCDRNGVSWTEREYDYAHEKGMHIFVMAVPEFYELQEKALAELAEDEKKLLAFSEKVEKDSFLCPVDTGNPYDYYIKVSQNLIPGRLEQEGRPGWSRNTDEEAWKQEHQHLDFSGRWYTFHVSNSDISYLRLGQMTIKQDFSSSGFRELDVQADNYGGQYDAEEKSLDIDFRRHTQWQADYEIYSNDDGTVKHLTGIFTAVPDFNSTFADKIIERGQNRGIHSFNTIGNGKDGRPSFLIGTFDNTRTDKAGTIGAFRDREMRDRFLKEQYLETLNKNIKEKVE